MPDLADLGIRVDSSQAAAADANLDGLAGAADRAETSVDKLAAAARRSDGAVSTMNVAIRQQTQVLTTTRNAMGLTANESLNLGRQIADIGVTGLSGMNPLMIVLQQGPQVLDIFQQAAIRTGQTTSQVAHRMAAAWLEALWPLIPIIAAIAAAVGAMAVAWGLATRSLKKDIGDVTDGMGLTEKQLERLKEKGVSTTATAGDAFKAWGTTIKEVFVATFGDQLDWVSKQWNAFLDGATKFANEAVKIIGAGFVGTFYTVRDTWRMLPAIIGDAAVTAANIAVRAVEWMVNKGVAGINLLIAGAKGLAAVNPAFSAANLINPLANVSLQGMNNPFSGAMARAATVAAADYVRAYEQTGDAMDRFYARWQANTEATARSRIQKAAGDPGADGSGRTPRERQEVQTLTNNVDGSLRDLGIKPIQVVEPLRLIADELRLVDSLAQETARGMADAFGESGRALGDLLTTLSGYQSRMADIALALKEHRLDEAQAAREMAFTQVQAYGDALGAAKGFFKEGSDGYRALQAAEQVYRAYQFAMMIQSIGLGAAETAASVGQSAIRGAASMAAGAAKMFEFLGPLGFPAVAAMLGLLAGLGLRGGSKGGSSSSVQASASTAQTQSALASSAQSSASTALAQSVEVKVTADRDGLNAYVVGTAKREALNVAVPVAAATSAGTKKDVFNELKEQQAGNRRATV